MAQEDPILQSMMNLLEQLTDRQVKTLDQLVDTFQVVPESNEKLAIAVYKLINHIRTRKLTQDDYKGIEKINYLLRGNKTSEALELLNKEQGEDDIDFLLMKSFLH